MKKTIKQTCEKLSKEFNVIPESRRDILQKIASFVQVQHDSNREIKLVYVCTHNSRRSHFGQVWGKVAAEYYEIPNVATFSAGTEATAMHPNTVNALRDIGFDISSDGDTNNPNYSIGFDDEKKPILCFSKTIDHDSNPKIDFAAIMTCSEAEENCPFVPGASLRVSTTYEDPKEFDGTSQQNEKYIERSLQIARENLYIFSLIQKK